MPTPKFKIFDEFAQENNLTKREEPGLDGKESYVRTISSKFGMPAYENDKKQISKINESFWAALYKHENVALYDLNPCKFYRYNDDSGIYEATSEATIREVIAERIFRAASEWGDKWIPLQRFRTTATLSAVVAHLRGMLEKRDAFANRPNIIHCSNCILQLNGEGKYKPAMFSHKHFSRHASPLNYEPRETCPEFKKRILDHLEEHNITTLQKAAGLSLIGRNLIQKIFILEGASGASKGAFLEVVKLIKGEVNCDELRVGLLPERFEIAGISDKPLLFGADVAGNFLSAPGASRLKALVGGDLLGCEFKGSMDRGTVRGEFIVMITSNSRLRIRLDSDRGAWRRRLVIITYETEFAGATIPEIARWLVEKEGPGILNWCIRGAELLMNDIRTTGDIVLSDQQKHRLESFLDESDSIRIFLQENVATGNDNITTTELTEAYVSYCFKRGWDPRSCSSFEKTLPDLMSELFGVSKSHNLERSGKSNLRGFRGVFLKSKASQMP